MATTTLQKEAEVKPSSLVTWIRVKPRGEECSGVFFGPHDDRDGWPHRHSWVDHDGWREKVKETHEKTLIDMCRVDHG